MRQIFSKTWIASKQPRKQRKYFYNAPLHTRRKFMSATLDKELRKKYGRRNIEIKKGDEVRVMRGKFRKKQGKVTEVNMKKLKISVEGIQATKKDGTKVSLWFHPSKLKIINLDISDVRRLKTSKKIREGKQPEMKTKQNKQNKSKGEKNAPKNK